LNDDFSARIEDFFYFFFSEHFCSDGVFKLVNGITKFDVKTLFFAVI